MSRIQLRLSRQAQIIIQEEKLKYLKNGIQETSGNIIASIMKEFKKDEKYKKIDWNKVRCQTEFDGIISEYTAINPTTLNLDSAAIAIIEDIRTHLNTMFQMNRCVYRSYIIRIVLKAYRLEQEGIEILL